MPKYTDVMSHNGAALDHSSEIKDKIFVLLLFALAIELVFFKFVPDLGTATLPTQGPSWLVSFPSFEGYFLNPGSVNVPRFAGTWVMLRLAKLIAPHFHSSDVRLHPLRLAAAILTPIYGIIGLLPVLLRKTRYSWRIYAALYCSYCVLSLYIFYPYDMPSIALISVAAYLVLEEELGLALVILLIAGLFRESSLHIVWFVFVWAGCSRTVPAFRRMMWAGVYAMAFVAEYLGIRVFYPGHGTLTLNPHEVLLGHGLWSLTSIVTLATVGIIPIRYLSGGTGRLRSDWRRAFFTINCYSTPAWIIFYRVLGGNISELRMLLPILLPIFYGLAVSSGE